MNTRYITNLLCLIRFVEIPSYLNVAFDNTIHVYNLLGVLNVYRFFWVHFYRGPMFENQTNIHLKYYYGSILFINVQSILNLTFEINNTTFNSKQTTSCIIVVLSDTFMFCYSHVLWRFEEYIFIEKRTKLLFQLIQCEFGLNFISIPNLVLYSYRYAKCLTF